MKQKTTFQGQEIFQIANGPGSIRIAPQYGARLLDWHVSGREVIVWPQDADWTQMNKVRGGNPILFPFLARHFYEGVLGRWRAADGTVRDLPMHGFARDEAYTVIENGVSNELVMRLEESPKTLAFYPFRFRFDVTYRLLPQTLEVELATTNTGTEPLPYYAGHHFYFAVDHRNRADWELTLPFAKTGRQTPDGGIEFGPPPATPANLAQPELIDRFQTGPTADRFTLTDRKSGMVLEFDLHPRETVPWHSVTTWTQLPESDFYCVEPWLGLPNAIHHGIGLRWLAPGATEKAVCAIHHRS